MKPRKFVGATSRDVLKQVRDAFGPEALIVSNAKVAGGVEIVALPGNAIGDLMKVAASAEPAAVRPEPAPARPAPAPAPARAEPAPARPDVVAAKRPATREAAQAAIPAPRRVAPAFVAREYDMEPPPEPALPEAAPPEPAPREIRRAASVADDRVETVRADEVIAELRGMRALIEHELAGIAWGELARREPAKVAALRTLLASGFSPALARRLVEPMPAAADERENLRWLATEINRNLVTAGTDNDIVERGGVYAIMGPTGVGKTTTTAKLAARAVVRHGAERVALLTTDTYRIGAHEQLRIYGRILGVTTTAVKDANDLRTALTELRGKHMVLIDTVGMSQRDRMVAEQAATLNRCGGNVKRLLLLNATCNGETLDDVVRCYDPGAIDGCILTKVDEAGGLGQALDTIIRQRLTLAFVANGQRVPEDLHAPNRQYLIHRALKAVPDDSPYALAESEYPLLVAASRAQSRDDRSARFAQAGGRRG